MKVKFQQADLNTPFVQEIIDEIAFKTDTDKTQIKHEIKIELEQRLANLNGPDSFHEVARQNAIESILFDKIKTISSDEEFNYEDFNYLYKCN